ncbi:right-handed parallel beta-helix repeat-containing protein [Nonomuraea jabiensis]|uniref:Pel9A-like right handed beta-helix region domain-containing protein n=1 Tax=Nonomuraea jabiensis TaxID=882448 RepID=A0A7W9GGL7_9ACTN|nr:right-handed parallel beta-helix repeat-containing protein [Nonomuraea jabiensis]MBB5783454.1 hypothetical protein [Nonomuraea jabiensis]
MHLPPRWRALRLIAAASAALGLSAAIAPGTAAASSAAAGNTYYVAPNGNDNAAGTQAAPWASIAHAQAVVTAGDTVYLRGGTYAYTRANSACASQTARVDAITLNRSGAPGNPIRYWAYPGEKPVFDFSRMRDDCRIKGFDVTGNWIHLKGLEVTGVPQNNNLNHESWGIWISGSNNTFELIDTHHHMGPGLFIQNGGGNLVLNTDSHDNYDLRSSNGAGESADGFGAHIPAGNAGNVFRGCRAWWNADDGFDLISAYSSVIIENSWAWRNGYVPGTTTGAGNGNGFKAGGYGGDYDPGAVKHTVRTSVAFLNKAAGFYANHHPIANDYFNNTSYGNHPDFNMLGVDSGGAAVGRGNLRNNLAYTGTLTSNMNGTNAAYNSWHLGVTLTDSQFQSVSTSGWDAPRQADGSLPALPHLRLAANSTLIDKGTSVGLPYKGSAPDLGAFEQSAGTPPAVRHEAESAPAVCPGTIDADHGSRCGHPIGRTARPAPALSPGHRSLLDTREAS